MHWRKWHKIEETILKGKESDVSGTCFFCKKNLDGMDYCFGCKEFVCGDCNQREPIGRHEVTDHQ